MTNLNLRWRLALSLCFCGSLEAALPAYTASSVFNTCDMAPGPYAPNTVMTILGSNLADSARAVTADDIAGGKLPAGLNGTRVFVDGYPTPIFYVSETQVNFLMPPNQVAGPVTVFVAHNGQNGPQIQLTLADAAPALFPSPLAPGYAIAQLWPDYSAISPTLPAHPGGVVILYAAGLGKTDADPALPNEIPKYPGVIVSTRDLQVSLDGRPMDPSRVLYAGLAPGWAGLYQIDLVLPDDAGRDPEIRVTIGPWASAPGLRLAVQ